jgi:hypothetical protein
VPLIVVGLWLGARATRAERTTLRWWLFAGMTILLVTTARTGAAGAYFLEWNCAVVLWIGPALVKAAAAARRRAWVLPVACAAQLLLADGFAAVRLIDEGTTLAANRRALPTMCAAIRSLQESGARRGGAYSTSVVTEDAGFVRACGVEPVHHSFIMANLASRRLWDERPFVEAIHRRAFAAVVLPFDVTRPIRTDRWTPPMLHAIRDSYSTVAEFARWRALAPGAAVTTRQPQ